MPAMTLHWYNEPPTWAAQDGTITLTTAPQTDFWRKTHYGFIRDSGHFYYQEITGDFALETRLTATYETLYDQAGLMVRLDETTWIKCGIELVGGVQHLSAVVTRDFSDWSVIPLPERPPTLWLRLTRRSETVEIHYSLDGNIYHMLRLAYFTTIESVQAGIMAASPEGKGFAAVFEDFNLSRL